MSVKQWWRRQETHFDWLVAWMGGGATAAFLAHDPGLGWLNAVLCAVFVACGVTAHVIREPS